MLKRPTTIGVGKLATARFPRGVYIYTGSAMNGLGARLERHLRRHKKLRWHIDYLLRLRQARIEKILLYPAVKHQECRQNQRIAARCGAQVVVQHFGATDCRSSCPSHLLYFAEAIGNFAFRRCDRSKRPLIRWVRR